MNKSAIAAFSGFALMATPTFAQDVHHSIDKITVQSVPWQARSDGLTQSVAILEGDVLENRLEGTLGETLAGLPGIFSTFFGPGASRPIIRGQSGDRVRILVGGIGSIDASTVSPDHAVAGESLSIERIEVIRGPSTLLYGPNAIGGVVNILDGRIPTAIPENGISGAARVHYGSVADERAVAASITAAAADNIALHLDGFHRQSGDYHVPRDAHEEGEKRIDNSDVKARGGNVGLSWIGDGSFLGLSASLNGSNYGVPGEDHHGEEGHQDEPIRIDLDQTRVDMMAGVDTDFLIFQQVKLRFGWADYEHTELEGDEIGTVFTNRGWEGRLDLVQNDSGSWSGGMGFQMKRRDFAAIGDEAFTPPSVTEQWGVFMAEEVDLAPFLLQGGLRYDQTSIKADTDPETKEFNQFSAALGAIWSLSDTLDLIINTSRTERAPTAEELFSNGAHLATQTFELGNPNLGKETAWSAEAGIRVASDAFHIEAYVYYTRYADYIHQADTDLIEEGLPILRYEGADATFKGFEIEAAYDLSDAWALRAQADLVRAKLRHTGDYLPRIPPFSLTAGLDYSDDRWDFGAEVVVVDGQNKVAASERTTAGHTFVNAYITWRPMANNPDISLNLRGKNLLNEAGFNHASFIKREAPLPGRDIQLSFRVRF